LERDCELAGGVGLGDWGVVRVDGPHFSFPSARVEKLKARNEKYTKPGQRQ